MRRAPVLIAALLLIVPQLARAQRIREIQVAPRYLRMRQDAVVQVSATAYDENGAPLDVRFRWRSSNINVASVDTMGNVHALGPGTSVVMATVDEQGRRRVGQLVVYVMRDSDRMPPPGRFTPGETPPKEMPGMPPPGMPPMPPGMVPGTPPFPGPAHFDSAMKASVNCADPMINAVNPMRACWDVRSVLSVEPSLPPPDQCPRGASAVGLLVKVSETGEVTDVQAYAPSFCQALTDSALALMRRMHFQPAMKSGQPVASWRMMRVRGQR